MLDVCIDKSLFVVREIPCMIEGFGKIVSVAGESRARPGNLTQASRTRLSESGGGSPKPFSPKVAQAANSLILSEQTTRPGERGLA